MKVYPMVEIHLNMKDHSITSVKILDKYSAYDIQSRDTQYGEVLKTLVNQNVVRNDGKMIVVNKPRTIVIFTFIKNFMEITQCIGKPFLYDEEKLVW